MSSNPTVSNVIGFAGGFALGAVQAGFELVADKALPGSFGYPSMNHNRDLLGHGWEHQEAQWHLWDVPPAGSVDMVIGNPPCSGFSTLASAEFKASGNNSTDCMRAFIAYAARVNPRVIIMESVQQAYTTTNGRSMMSQLFEQLQHVTRDSSWQLHHVLHNTITLGGSQIRPRYFWVAARIPFGVAPKIAMFGDYQLPTLWDAIGDLEKMNSYNANPRGYVGPACGNGYAKKYRSSTTIVDGCVVVDSVTTSRLALLADAMDDVRLPWLPYEDLSEAMEKYYRQEGKLPSCIKRSLPMMLERNWELGFNQPKRLDFSRYCRVLTGGAMTENLHPTQNRALTAREVFRLSGFPDDWRLLDFVGTTTYGKQFTKWPGKGVTVEAGRWIAAAAKAAIEGNPYSNTGRQSISKKQEFEHFDESTHLWEYGPIRSPQ